MNDFGLAQTLSDQVDVPLRGGNSARRFLLKGVQDLQHALEPDCVDRPVGIAVKVIPNLENSTEPFEGPGVPRMIAELSFEKRLTDFSSHGGRKCPEIFPARAHENGRLDRSQEVIHEIIVIYL
ncbi:MAG: hypothetical protein ACT4OC_15130 [Bradyrhizobium sp.]